jgi:hypothetical protein
VVDDGVDFLLGKMDQLEEGMLQIVLPDMVVAGLD